MYTKYNMLPSTKTNYKQYVQYNPIIVKTNSVCMCKKIHTILTVFTSEEWDWNGEEKTFKSYFIYFSIVWTFQN